MMACNAKSVTLSHFLGTVVKFKNKLASTAGGGLTKSRRENSVSSGCVSHPAARSSRRLHDAAELSHFVRPHEGTEDPAGTQRAE